MKCRLLGKEKEGEQYNVWVDSKEFDCNTEGNQGEAHIDKNSIGKPFRGAIPRSLFESYWQIYNQKQREQKIKVLYTILQPL